MWKVVFAIFLNLALVVFAPYLLVWLGLMPPIAPKSWIILVVTSIGLTTRTVFADLISNDFSFHRHGYDLSLTSLASSMSGASLQLLAEDNLFPGVPYVPLGRELAYILSQKTPRDISIAFLFSCFTLSMAGTVFTAWLCNGIERRHPRSPSLLAVLSFVIGSGLIGLYIMSLIVRAPQ